MIALPRPLDITVKRCWSWSLGWSWEGSFRVGLGGHMVTMSVVSYLGAGAARELAEAALESMVRETRRARPRG